MIAISPWRSRTARSFLLQGGFLILLVGAITAAFLTARANLSAQGMTSGFDFLWKSTGWEMNFTLFPAAPTDPYWWFLFLGLINTLVMGLLGLGGATVIGLAVGLMRSGQNPAARLLATVYIEIFRNLPLILQLFFWYALANSLPNPREAVSVGSALLSSRGIYLPGLAIPYGAAMATVGILFFGFALSLWFTLSARFNRMERALRRRLLVSLLTLTALVAASVVVTSHVPGADWVTRPELKGLRIDGGIRIQPEFACLAIAIMTYGGAYVGEIVRGGFKAVGRGQTEAARALGLSPWQVFSRVRLPLAFRAMLPILINQYVWLIKATTLGIAVGFSDFFMVIASSITHSGQTLELIGILMGGFLALNFTLSAILNRVNRAIALKGHNMGGAA